MALSSRLLLISTSPAQRLGLVLLAACLGAVHALNQFQQTAPTIYTIHSEHRTGDGQRQPSSATLAGQPWNNRRLAKQTLQEPEAPLGERFPISSYQTTDELSESSPVGQFGDLSLLYGQQQQQQWSSPARAATKTGRATKSGPAIKGVGKRRPSPGRAQPKSPPRHRHAHAPPSVGQSFSPDDRQLAANESVASRRAGPRRKHLVCYYGTWAVYRPEAGKYPVENIDPFLCTHVVYGFTGLSYDNTIKPLDPWNDLEDNYGKGAMRRFTNLKRINPDLKTLVAIGGWNEGSIKYSKMAGEAGARARFVESVVQFLQKYNFDGLDLDWEYPAARGGAPQDKQNLVSLLRELSEAFAPHNFLLTAAVSAGRWFAEPAYDIPQVSKYLDLINLMAYDYHGGWETKTGHNAPLFHSERHDLSREERQLNVNWSVNYWLAQGAPREKLLLGVGSYGRSFTLDRPQSNGINAPASQKGQAGPYTREPGSLGYNEICEAFQRQPGAWTIVRDPDYLAPYAYSDRQWVGYDDRESLALKAQFAKSMGLGGMMMWSIETDDFQGACHAEKYPLLNTIRRVLDGAGAGPGPTPPPAGTGTTSASGRRPAGAASTSRRPAVTPTTPGREVEDDQVPSSTAGYQWATSTSSTSRRPRPAAPSSSSRRPATERPAPQSTTTTSTTRRPPVAPGQQEFAGCRSEGMFAEPRNCRKFIRCVGSGAGFVSYQFDCAPGTAFNEALQYCDYAYNVPACQRSSLVNEIATGDDERDERQRKRTRPSQAPDWRQVQQRPLYPGYFAHSFVVHHQWR